jgi:bifunctional UDP-N-acetylglucosamine pyrophosphorylase/glucosamine-1-phosphate N-acetyltransferase
VAVRALMTQDQPQVDGVNSPVQLAELERSFQLRQAQRLLNKEHMPLESSSSSTQMLL